MRAFPELSVKQEEALKEEARERSRKDLHYLARHLLGYDRVTDHIHKQMAREVDVPGYKFKLLLWPRGHFKSTIVTESGAIHRLLRNPNERILITNAKLGNSIKFLRTVRDHFKNNSKFRWAWRDWWIDSYASEYDREAMGDKLDWVVRDVQDELTLMRPRQAREASITAAGVDASMVSQHYSTIIADDLIDREYVRTQTMVEKSILYFRDLLDLLDPDGELVVVGTRWSYMDLYSWIIDEFGGKATLRVPDDYLDEEIVQASEQTPEEEKEWLFTIRPAFNGNGDPIFPEEFTHEVLRELQRAKGAYEFGAQYMLDPISEENQTFKEEWMRKTQDIPSLPQLDICMTVDPAKSLEDNRDRSAVAVFGYDERNRMYLIDGLNEQLVEDELLDAVFEMATMYMEYSSHFYPVGFEAVGFQETYVHALERRMLENNTFFAIEPIKRRQSSKEERIRRLVPRVKHGFYLPRTLMIKPRTDRDQPYCLVRRLKAELLNFPRARYDDLADATADQLEIVPAKSLPRGTSKTQQQRTPTFGEKPQGNSGHPSILRDKAKRRRKITVASEYSDAVR